MIQFFNMITALQVLLAACGILLSQVIQKKYLKQTISVSGFQSMTVVSIILISLGGVLGFLFTAVGLYQSIRILSSLTTAPMVMQTILVRIALSVLPFITYLLSIVQLIRLQKMRNDPSYGPRAFLLLRSLRILMFLLVLQQVYVLFSNFYTLSLNVISIFGLFFSAFLLACDAVSAILSFQNCRDAKTVFGF